MCQKKIAIMAIVFAALVSDVLVGEPAVPFSSLPKAEQYKIREMVAPPDLSKRYGCYSTPMYYLFFEGLEYKGNLDCDPNNRVYPETRGKNGAEYGYWKLNRNRPDWQEVVIRDWAELGLNNTHFNIYPEDSGLKLSLGYRKAIADFTRLSEKYGLKVGVRLDPPIDQSVLNQNYWLINPDNPDNLIGRYLLWVKDVVDILKGRTVYYVVGDEINFQNEQTRETPRDWTAQKYLTFFKQVNHTIKEVDPAAKVSMFAVESGRWSDVLKMLKTGYSDYGDAVAINYYNYQDVPRFFNDARKLAPQMLFLSNGVGYCSNGLAQPRYPDWDPYYKYASEQAHGHTIAKNMFAWWDLGAATAPYYICLRNFVVRGKVYPWWYGFFGFQDFIVDEYDNLTIKRYPGWYAYQTIANTFYNRDDFKKPAFDISCTPAVSMFRAYEHNLTKGAELLIMLWNDNGPSDAAITIKSKNYEYPVRISTFNYHDWSDLPYKISDDDVQISLNVDAVPVIIRLVEP